MKHPTIRALSGVPPLASLAANRTALVVIDFQMEYFEGGRLLIPDGRAALSNAARLVRFANSHRIPVFHVQHLGPAGGPLFARDSANSAFHPELVPQPHHVVVQKAMPSSFAGTDLHRQLQAQEIKTLVICGLMTHMCVSTTARDARPLGYQAVVAGDACATRDIEGWDGGTVGHAELHRAALTALSDSFAAVLPTGAITALATR